jgi:hypothetical protein
MPIHEAPAPDAGVALQAAATRLQKEFEGVDRNTVDQLLHSSYDQFASAATVFTFLPLLAERAARQELKAFSTSSRDSLVQSA